MSLPFSVEAKVRCRNQVWEVIKITDNQDGTFVIRMVPEGEGKPQSFLYPHTPIERVGSAIESLRMGRIDHIDHYRLLTNATRLSLVYEYDKLLSISNSKMVPELYQLMAVKKVMESLRQRFLIADDVGLGKTIEAGLIMQELAARRRGTRVLIIVPASLQDQWKKEMQRHFLRKFYIYNSRKMEGIQELVDENLNPWLARNAIITSIDWIKPQYEGTGAGRRNTNKFFDQLLKVERRWDLVMIDEAHYVSTDSNRADLAKEIQERSDSLLLLTATPHSGNPEHFFNLLNLIDPFMFSDPEDLDRADARPRVEKVMIRRGKETIFEKNGAGQLIKKFKERDVHPVQIPFTPEEDDLYKAVSGYTGDGWAELNRKRKISAADLNIGKFLLALVQKRMVSSLAALRETLKRRIDSIVVTRTISRVSGDRLAPDRQEIQRLLKDYQRGEFMEDEDREMVERYIETRDVQAMYAERTNEVKTLRNLLEMTEELIQRGQDSKLKYLKKFLKELLTKDSSEKVIVFTEYRDTLNYLKEHLQKEWYLSPQSIVLIHGGMPLGEDENEEGSKLYAERRFNDSDTRLLLATDAASEGLNLQRYCHTLINYELPWNPNRLEQRIGRIHRYGQRYDAQIYNFMIEGSKEAQIFTVLQNKIETIRRQLGNMAEVLGILDRISLDDLILRVLKKSVDSGAVEVMAEQELRKMDEMAQAIQKTQFLSGCRQFTSRDIAEAEVSVREAQEAIPTHKDVRAFVEAFLRVYGEQGAGDRDGRKLQSARDKNVFRLIVPAVLQDDKLPKVYPRVTFERCVATGDWARADEPEFVAFGHPLLERMVHFCRVTKAAELGGQLACLVADYSGAPGVVFNFVLRFEDLEGRVIREELEPVFVDEGGSVKAELGRKLFLAAPVPRTEPNREFLARLGEKVEDLRGIAEAHIRHHYLDYYRRVEQQRLEEIAVLLEDLDRFDRGAAEQFQEKQRHLHQEQQVLFDDPNIKGLRTRLDNQIKSHQHNMSLRRQELERMKLGAFPAPALLNLVVVTPA
jgi:SNF2 family DNA or RNA helicase